MNKKLYGYVYPRKFGNFAMPIPAQSTCIRDYAFTNKFIYVFPIMELYYENCYAQLFKLFSEAPRESDICCYSVEMLPRKGPKFNYLCNVMEDKKFNLHFILEKKIVGNYSELKKIVEAYEFAKLIENESDVILSKILNLKKKIVEDCNV